MHEAMVDGRRIAYTRVGLGPALVLLHGGLGDSRSWRPQLEACAAEHTVLAWDAPGCGRSSDPPATWRMPEYADCVAGWLGAIGVDRAHVLGLSWGSSLALELYRRHPGLPSSLVLASAYAGWAGSLPPGEVAERVALGLAWADLPGEEIAAAFLPTLLTPDAAPDAVEDVLAVLRDVRGAGTLPALLSMAEADLRDVLPTIRVPTLLLYGSEDVRSPLRVAHELHRAIPGSDLVVLPGVGHESNFEAPDAFTREVLQFLRRASGRTAEWTGTYGVLPR